MILFDPSEKVEFIAAQSLHYDRYSGCLYFLERVDVNGKCGLICGKESDDYGTHSQILLEPIYMRSLRMRAKSGSSRSF